MSPEPAAQAQPAPTPVATDSMSTPAPQPIQTGAAPATQPSSTPPATAAKPTAERHASVTKATSARHARSSMSSTPSGEEPLTVPASLAARFLLPHPRRHRWRRRNPRERTRAVSSSAHGARRPYSPCSRKGLLRGLASPRTMEGGPCRWNTRSTTRGASDRTGPRRPRNRDFFGYQNEVWSRNDVQGYDELVDMRGVEDVGVPTADSMRALASLSAEMDPPRTSAGLAIIAPQDFAYGRACTKPTGAFSPRAPRRSWCSAPRPKRSRFWASMASSSTR